MRIFFNWTFVVVALVSSRFLLSCGSSGSDGADGSQSLVSMSDEAAGANCTNGGKKIETGIDDNNNGVLDAAEVDNTLYVCNGSDGTAGADGFASLVSVTDEAAGGNCADGGERVDIGLDNGDGGGTTRDGVLQAGEIDTTYYVCDGAAGTAGLQSLVRLSPSPSGLVCLNGGTLVEVGIDDNDNGVLESSEVDSATIVCHGAPSGWATAELIEADNAGDALDPQVTVDGSGNVTAVWWQLDGTRNNIWANRYVPGTGWGTAELIETDNAGDAFDPQVTVDGSGNVTAVWSQFDSTWFNIWANRYVPGTGWGTAELIETDVEDAGSARVTVDGSGNVTAVWYQFDGTRNNIWANRYVPGTGWGTAELIETDNAGDTVDPQVTVDGSGNVTAVWYQSDGTRFNIWANRYVPGTGWETAELIETDNAGSAFGSQITVDNSGNVIAVWHQSDGTRFNIWANRYVPGTGWGTAELIETDNAGNALDPQVTVDGSGNVTAVWWQFDGTRFNIWANRYVPGTGWVTAELIETDNAGSALDPQVTVDGNGNVTAVWSQFDGTRASIWANRYVPGTGWGTAELIETDNAGDADRPQVTVDGSGNVIAVWSQFDGARNNIWTNRYVAGP